MRIAYCILCHKYTPVLDTLVDLIGSGNDIWVHVDAKADISRFAPLADRVNFLEGRVRVTWGGYSQIEATLRLLDATRARDCDYVALVSGDTLPLRPDADIRRFLWENRGCEFIFERPLLRGHADRVRFRYPERRLRFWSAARRRLGLLPRNRYFDTLPPLHFGSNWFVVTPGLRDYIFDFLGQHPEYTEAFRYSNCGDELFFATIAANSPFADRLDPRRYMYVDWTTGPDRPRLLDESDFPRLKAASELWARKFSDTLDTRAYREYMGL